MHEQVLSRSRRQASALVSLCAVLVLVLPLLAGCARQPTPSSPPTATATQPPPTATPGPTSTPTPEPTESPEPTPVPQASFSSGPCPFELPVGQAEGTTVECGYLTVPEDRGDPESPEIRLAVAIFHPDSEPEPDPIVYLEGGPGGSPLELIEFTFAQQFEPLLEAGRDLIVFDQRGVGHSKPSLACPKWRELGLDLLDEEIDGRRVGEDEALDLIMEAALACRGDLEKKAELGAYNTAASAADVEDLRRALDYEQVNLWGVSYGTWLALEVMRRYPEGIRSVVLDSVFPPQQDLLAEAPTNAARSINLLFDACAADEACNSAFPDLESVYLGTVDRLNAEPATFETTNPLTGESYDVLMTGDNLAGLLFHFLYGTSVIPSLPQILADAGDGNYTAIAQLLGSLLVSGQAVSHGQQLSVLCHDEIPFSSPQQFETALAEHPDLERTFEDSVLGVLGVEICADWQVGQGDDTLTQPVTSDIPTLVMAGEYDPITPPAWGRQAAETLGNSHFFVYPGVGHGASVVAGCPQAMVLAFLADPLTKPDDACVSEMETGRFVVPGEPEAIDLVPFTNEAMGIQGLMPKGWTEVQPGVYTRGRSATDAAVLLAQAAPTTADELLSLVAGQLGLGEPPAGAGQRQANNLTWSLYAAEVQGLSIDLGLAESGGKALLVLVQSDPREREALYQAVFLPVIDALVPVP